MQYKEQIFIEPIFNFFQGKGNLKIQHTSSIYLQEFAEYLISSQDNELFTIFKEKTYALFLVNNLISINFTQIIKEIEEN